MPQHHSPVNCERGLPFMSQVIRKVLIANRGEIALRIVRACAEANIRSVAVYTEPDRYGLFVKRANEAYSLGFDPLTGYLDPTRIVNLAVETGCDAIHPGYGFLSENPELARLCAEKGVTFIGPSAEVIRRMGDKTQARLAMTEAGVPVTPGSPGNLDNIEQALAEASRIGYPVMVKATSGGGGRGIRRCDNEEELKKQFPRVISEATKAFGSAKVFLEKCIVDPKHIEVQILADSLAPELAKLRSDISDLAESDEDVLTFAMFPDLGREFLEQRRAGALHPEALLPADSGNSAASTTATEFKLDVHGETYEVAITGVGDSGGVRRKLYVSLDGMPEEVIFEPLNEYIAEASGKRMKATEPGHVTAAMPGNVVEVLVKQGDEVSAGQAVIVTEAMKMESEINTNVAGKVLAIKVAKGDRVTPGEMLMEIG